MDDRTWEWLSAALETDPNKADGREEIEAQIKANRAQLWCGDEGAIVTQLLRAPDGLFVHCWLGGGSMKGCLELRPGIEAWARQMGCAFASINGRRGWDRVFRRFGYERVGEEMVKDLWEKRHLKPSRPL